MKQEKLRNGRIIFAIILICLPLVVCYLICNYSYNRHKDNALNIFFSEKKFNKKEEVKDSLYQYEAYLEYTTYNYKKVFEKSVIDKGDKVLDLACYAVIYASEENREFEYRFVTFNVNYELLEKMAYTGQQEYKFLIDDIPNIYVYVADAYDPGQKFSYTKLEEFYDLYIQDYGRGPEIDSAGTRLESTNIQTGSRLGVNMPGDEVTIDVVINDDAGNEVKMSVIDYDHKLEIDRVLIDVEDDLASFNEGFNNNYKLSGYEGYIFRKYWWWEGLLSLILVGALSYFTYIVMTYEKE